MNHDVKTMTDGAAVVIGLGGFMGWMTPVVTLVGGVLTIKSTASLFDAPGLTPSAKSAASIAATLLVVREGNRAPTSVSFNGMYFSSFLIRASLFMSVHLSTGSAPLGNTVCTFGCCHTATFQSERVLYVLNLGRYIGVGCVCRQLSTPDRCV